MKIYEAKNHILIHADNISPIMHSHMAAHIVISLGGDITLSSDKFELTGKGMLIPAGARHKINTFDFESLVFLYDCNTFVSRQIKQIKIIPEEICTNIKELYCSLQENVNSDIYYKFENLCHAYMGIYCSDNITIDDRIKDAVAYIQTQVNDKLTCKSVAEQVYLSQGRFSHLFKENIGMTFSAYLIYQRLMSVYTQIIAGKSITEASLNAGFSSSAHYADVNRRIFGMSASSITQDLKFIKI